MKYQDMEGYDELVGRLLDTVPAKLRVAGLPAEQVLSHYTPEQRLTGVPPEQRLADLDRDHQVLAFPFEVLRLLPEEYLRSLAPAVELEIRRRICSNRC